MDIKEINKEILRLENIKRALEKKEIDNFKEKAKLNIGRCFIVNGEYVMIIDIPKEKQGKTGEYHFNPYQYPALYLGNNPNIKFFNEELDTDIIPFYYGTVFSDIVGEAHSHSHRIYKEITKEEYYFKFNEIIEKFKNDIKEKLQIDEVKNGNV